MRLYICTAVTAWLLAVAALAQSTTRKEVFSPMPLIPLPAGMEVEFSADGTDLVERIAGLIDTAKREVLVSHYAVTDLRVLQALTSAAQRGVIVALVLDAKPSVRNYETPAYLRARSISVFAAKRGAQGAGWHNQRYVIIDREAVAISSCDLTGAAARNTENLLVLRNNAVAARYFNAWLNEAGTGQKLP